MAHGPTPRRRVRQREAGLAAGVVTAAPGPPRERVPQRLRDDAVRTVAATHREQLHRADLELGDLEAHEYPVASP